MTEKRFTIEKDGGLYRIFDGGELIPILDGQPICDLLNKLSEENEQLKKDIEYYKEERKALFEYLDKKDDLKLELRVDLND